MARARLGAETGHAQQSDQPLGHLDAQSVVVLHVAGGQVLDDPGFERGTDAVDLAQPALGEEPVEPILGADDVARGDPVGVGAIAAFTLDLEHPGDLGEQLRDVLVQG